MSKPIKLLIASGGLLLALLGVFLLLNQPQPSKETEEDTTLYLVNRGVADIATITISNTHDTYTVTQGQNGGFTIQDLPPHRVNQDYLNMLLDECSAVRYVEVAHEAPVNLDAYGLQSPVSTVTVTYTDGQQLQLLVGNEEPLSGGRFVMAADNDTSPVLLMKNNRTIRFTLPLTGYIDYVITPFCDTGLILGAMHNVSLSGKMLPQPIDIVAVDANNPEQMRQAASFGVATHLVTAPGLHEINQTQCIAVFQALMGLLSDGIVAYNCTDEQLAGYGFNDPWLQADFTYTLPGQTEATTTVLKVAQYEGGLIVTRDNDGIVYRINPQEFDAVVYEQLVMRWFYTPFITDLNTMTVQTPNETYRFEFTGEDNRSLAVTINGKPVDIEPFRKYYALIVNASHNGERAPGPASGEPLLSVSFAYRDTQKPDDTMAFYAEATPRRVAVETNGITEFMMFESYVDCVLKATEALLQGQDFSVDW